MASLNALRPGLNIFQEVSSSRSNFKVWELDEKCCVRTESRDAASSKIASARARTARFRKAMCVSMWRLFCATILYRSFCTSGTKNACIRSYRRISLISYNHTPHTTTRARTSTCERLKFHCQGRPYIQNDTKILVQCTQKLNA